ncbi:Antitoxin HigA / unknown domain [hydrothermal vent metagenome]|uniref:HTH cro/C1-type domain-containing protein n=1 Tax=hydrothermal vent metagenome TaxID=652676 RepID=A0A3B1CVL6_9ZZZZ
MVVKYKPFLNIGPGEFVKEELEARNWRQEDLASILGVSLKSVNKLIQNKQSITIEMAKLLSRAFGQSPQYWINLDTNYRLRLKEEDPKVKDVEVRAEIYKRMPVNEMTKKGWLDKNRDTNRLIEQVKHFWGIEEIDLSFMDRFIMPNFRKSEAFTQYNKYYALTWFRMAKNCAGYFRTEPYNQLKLNVLATNFHQYTSSSNGVKLLLGALNRAGVKFFVLSHLQKTYIDGASFFDGEKPVIVYTKRHDRVDNFWFTIAHEIGHILLHLKNKDDFFIDNLDDLKTEQEEEANKFAEKILKADKVLQYFEPLRKYISQKRVLNGADELRINPAIVVGMLQHHGWLSRRNLNRYKTSVSDIIPAKYYVERQIKKIKKAVNF